MSTTYTPSISFSGVGTGIDSASIIASLMKIERQPIAHLENQKTGITAKQGVIQELNGLLGKLRDAAAAMYSPTALRGTGGTSADATVATATTGSAAPAGTYNVVVTALAQSHTTASSTAPALVAGQTLDITVGGTTTGIAVEDGDTLASFAARINADDGAGVSASVVNDRLVLISRATGAGGAISLGGDAAPGFGFTTTQSAQDASATINGLVVTSSGNTITGAINDTTLTLGKVGSTTVTVGLDAEAAAGQAQAFVDAYNSLMANIRSATKFDPASKTAGTLQGDQAVNQIAGRLRSIAGAAVAGLGGVHDSLAQIGITSARDGTLTLDKAAFGQAMAADPAAVRSVFGRDDGVEGAGAGDGIARQISALSTSLSDEVISSRLSGYTASLRRLDDRVASLEQLMALKEKTLQAQWKAMEIAVSQLQGQGNQIASRLAALG